MKTFLQKELLIVISAAGLTAASSINAATLDYVPMQGGMVHVNIGYTTSGGEPQLYAHVESAIPALTPLLVSNPADCFAPDAPWFRALDPRACGNAFSRRYGFVLDVASEPIPATNAVCVRQLTFPPGLEVYRYRQSPPTFEPMFGTAGATNLWQWNLAMFHPTFVAPPVVTNYEATFEAFLTDSAGNRTGPSARFTLWWTVVEPLRLAGICQTDSGLELSFNTCSNGVYLLERSQDLTHWAVVAGVTNAPPGPQLLLDTNPPQPATFYRLRTW